jgi:hypothetical protein
MRFCFTYTNILLESAIRQDGMGDAYSTHKVDTIFYPKTAIFNRCTAAHWCDGKGPQVCRGSFWGGVEKKGEKMEE